jgi:Fusaric acid resistance protein-like
VRALRAGPLFAIGPAAPGPALRRGFLLAIPVGAVLLLELGLDSPTKGAIGTGAMLTGFQGMDAVARTRAAWQAAVAPLVGVAAALGALTAGSTGLAVATMAVVAAGAGYSFAVSLRFSIAGLMVALSLLISQGLFLTPADAVAALLFATAGGLVQVAFSLAIWAWEGTCRWREAHMDTAAPARSPEPVWDWRGGVVDLRTSLTLRSHAFRHALRFGAAMAVGVAVYRLLDMDQHGFWVPLTILFVLRPEEDETFHRLVLRAVGTALGLLIATALGEALLGDEILVALLLTAATGFAYGLLTVQYALFTTAITVYAVLLADTLGEAALHAAGQRAYATAIGIAIAGIAFLVWSNPARGGGASADAALAPPRPAR